MNNLKVTVFYIFYRRGKCDGLAHSVRPFPSPAQPTIQENPFYLDTKHPNSEAQIWKVVDTLPFSAKRSCREREGNITAGDCELIKFHSLFTRYMSTMAF